MKSKTALKIILCISAIGILFSGYLSFFELFRKVCIVGCSNLFGLPVCVYGFIMYIIVFIIALIGLKGKE